MTKCKYCGFENSEDSTYCINCGMPLVETKKIVCPICGKMIRGDEKFCPHCGASLVKKRYCPNCGEEVGINDKFCKNCGVSLMNIESNNITANINTVESTDGNLVAEKADVFDEEIEDIEENDMNNKITETEVVEKEETIDDSAIMEDTNDISDEVIEEGTDIFDENEEMTENQSGVNVDSMNSVDEISDISMDSETIEEEFIEEPSQSIQKISLEAAMQSPTVFVDYAIQEAEEYYAQGNLEEAIKYCNKGVGAVIKNKFDKQEDRRLIKLYLLRGEMFQMLGEVERARDNYKRALIYAQSIFAVDEVEKIKEFLSQI